MKPKIPDPIKNKKIVLIVAYRSQVAKNKIMSQNLQNYTLSLTHILSVHRQVYKLLKASNPQGHHSLLVTKLVHLFDEQDPEKQLSECPSEVGS